MKKGQIEIMGLVVIVLLVTIAFFFSFSLKEQPTTKPLPEVYNNEQLASDFLITFLETHDPGCGIKIRDLAIDCARLNVTETGRYTCGNNDSCHQVNHTLSIILDETLNEWNYAYTLTLDYVFGTTERTIIRHTNYECGQYQERGAPGVQPISLHGVVPGEIIMTLDIC